MSLLFAIGGFWLCLFALLKSLEVRSKGSLSRWLQSHNISLYLGYISWTTSKFNNTLLNFSNKYRRILNLWFTLGLLSGLIGLVCSVILLIANLVFILSIGVSTIQTSPVAHVDVRSLARTLSNTTNTLQHLYEAEEITKQALHAAEFAVELTAEAYGEAVRGHVGFIAPLLPGINLPKSQLWYVLIALLVSAAIHECGHALAAGVEDLRVTSVGGFIALVFPGAFVQIDGVDQVSAKRQLKVYCAGAWHNVVTALFCLLFIFALPLLLFPLYMQQAGSVVLDVPPGSVLGAFVSSGDLITSIGQYPTPDRESFAHALAALKFSNDTRGFCLQSDFVAQSEDDLECCLPFVDNQILGLSPASSSDDATKHKNSGSQCFILGDTVQYHCLQPRLMTNVHTCSVSHPCSEQHVHNDDDHSEEVHEIVADGDCYFPVLPKDHKLIEIRLSDRARASERQIYFQGQPEMLAHSVILSNYMPRFAAVLDFSGLYRPVVSLNIPRKLDRLFRYTFSISLCLAILNMAPVYFLDGEATAILFVKLFFPRMTPRTHQSIKSISLKAGTTLLLCNIFVSLSYAL